MSWRNSLGKGKYKTSARKRNFKVPKVLLIILFLSGVLFVLFYFSLIPFSFINGTELESFMFKETNQ